VAGIGGDVNAVAPAEVRKPQARPAGRPSGHRPGEGARRVAGKPGDKGWRPGFDGDAPKARWTKTRKDGARAARPGDAPRGARKVLVAQ
jgi:hypothetical protein